MPKVTRRALIDASPEEVFDVVADVEGFSRYSSCIKEVREASPGVFVWRAEVLGITLTWEAVVTESTRPVRYAWASTGGVFNRGSYTIRPSGSPSGAKIEVTFEMEYRLADSPLGEVLSPVLSPVISAVAGELMERIEKEFIGRARKPS